jgi:hypothetical protein
VYIISKFCTITIFVIVDLQTNFTHDENVMIYLNVKFHMPSFSSIPHSIVHLILQPNKKMKKKKFAVIVFLFNTKTITKLYQDRKLLSFVSVASICRILESMTFGWPPVAIILSFMKINQMIQKLNWGVSHSDLISLHLFLEEGNYAKNERNKIKWYYFPLMCNDSLTDRSSWPRFLGR